MRSAQEAVAYARALHALVRWIDICDGNMQEGSFRCDANVSVRPAGSDKLGTRCEIKNLNSFRFLERAIEFEAKRQIGILEDGGKIVQETRLYDAERDETRSMRMKEEAHDYRYFPDPDLLPLVVTEEQIQSVRDPMPELPDAMRQRFISDLEIPLHIATGLTASRDQADLFQNILMYISKKIPPTDKSYREVVRNSGNSVVGEVSAVLSSAGFDFSNNPIAPKDLAEVQLRIADGTISGRIAKEQILPALLRREGSTDEIIAKYGLKQISDSGELERICDQVIAAYAQQVADYKGGKDRAFNSLVGQVMKLTKGKANPQQVSEILKRKLGG
jgi:aspartyl-tRNA(Asn)/glutamyl-tRNA(Gln) amidotransferase subunit B